MTNIQQKSFAFLLGALSNMLTALKLDSVHNTPLMPVCLNIKLLLL